MTILWNHWTFIPHQLEPFPVGLTLYTYEQYGLFFFKKFLQLILERLVVYSPYVALSHSEENEYLLNKTIFLLWYMFN